MTVALQRWLIAWLLATVAVAGWAAETRVLVVREDSAIAREAAKLLGGELARQGWSSTEAIVAYERPVPDLRRDGEQAIVALGSRAFVTAMRQTGGRSVVAALITLSGLEDLLPIAGERWSAIVLDQPAERWLNLIQTAMPGRQPVGMLVGPAGLKQARAMERKLQDRRWSFAIESVASPEEVVPAIERLLPHIGLLLALPDPLAHNRNTVQPLLLTTYRAGIPVVAYSESYQQAGAVLALYSTVPQIVAQVMDTLRQFLEGRAPANVQLPRYFTVGINTAVARSLGLKLPSAAELAERLRSLDQ